MIALLPVDGREKSHFHLLGYYSCCTRITARWSLMCSVELKSGIFECQNWHILETVFYHLWWIVTCQLWFDSKIGTKCILCSTE